MNNTVIKAFEILKLVSHNKSGLTLAQITRSLNLSKSTAFNIVHTLTNVGLLTMEKGQLPVYRMGIESLKLGLAYGDGYFAVYNDVPAIFKVSADTAATLTGLLTLGA